MGRRTPLPNDLPGSFGVCDALRRGVSASRLRGSDLARPFHGVRATDPPPEEAADPWRARRERLVWLARAYAPRMSPGQFFSHDTAAALWGAPLSTGDDVLDVTTLGSGALVRATGVRGHRATSRFATVRDVAGLPVSSPATTWAMLGRDRTVDELVAVGDHLCRNWRRGFGRPGAGHPPLTTVDELGAALAAGRRLGIGRLREALPLVRTDAWSPRETATRLAIVRAGLPEPQLNVDVFDETGGFLACVDLCYPEQRVAIEYQGQRHGAQYARDVERIERLRAAGWIVIQVTSELLRFPEIIARRVREALASRR